jgi:hypothetical protein
MDEVLDTKPYIEYHPTIGYCYKPNTRQVLPRPGGGKYEIIINSAGIRSAREYTKGKPPGIFRVLVFGDSYAAGQFVSNGERFSELLERRLTNVEIINFGLEGTGTDQQLLIYEEIARSYEHDLVLLFPFLQNIRRNMVQARIGHEPGSGVLLLRPKPRFDLINGDLTLTNVPVPREPISTGSEEMKKMVGNTDTPPSLLHLFKSRLNMIPGISGIKKVIYSAFPWEPFPEYRNANTPEWQLMEAIIRRFKKSAGEKPLVVLPVFYDSYVCLRMARNYWDRFTSLNAVSGLFAIDLLPYFMRIGPEAKRAYLGPHDCHFSAYGHLVLADALQSELIQLGLLPICRRTH